MIAFELANPDNVVAPSVVVYTPGQDYVMFNGLMWHLDRQLPPDADGWVGCVFGARNTLSFIDGSSGEVVHSARLMFSKPKALLRMGKLSFNLLKKKKKHH
jgi:hypothetical protein